MERKNKSSLTTLLCMTSLLFLVISLPPQINCQTFTSVFDPLSPLLNNTHGADYTGTAWVDYDGDGLLDIIVTGFGTNYIYHNDGGGVFSVPVGNPILTDTRTFRGVTCADYDNDGDPDCFLSGQSGSSLYRNDGGTFVRVSDVDFGTADARGWSPAWGDFDSDGNLDLFITFPSGFVGDPNRSNRLLRNAGPPNYTFEVMDTTEASSVLAPYTSVNWSDYDLDGDLDLFVASGPASNFVAPDYIYKNMLTENGAFGFEKITTGEFATDAADGQVFNMIDYDNDGDFDIHRTNWGAAAGPASRRNDLYRNDNGIYTEITTGNIVTDQFVSLGALWEDFDNDGDIDCYVANTTIDNFYRNNNDGTFTSITAGSITTGVQVHTGATAGDYDNDGDLDIFAIGKNLDRTLFRNDTDNGNGWIRFNLEGVYSNRSAVGAIVRVKANIGGTDVWQMRDISTQNSFLGHSSLLVHFGLGDASTVDSVQIIWPSGIIFDTASIAINQLVTIVESCADADMDSVLDCFDNCVADANPSQEDADSDGIGDVCDSCPNDPENDSDTDSFCADVDNCPLVSNVDQLDTDNDGIGDACCCQKRGNVDNDPLLSIDIADLVALVDFMFSGGTTPGCPEQGDINADLTQDVADLVYLVEFMFNSGPIPPACI